MHQLPWDDEHGDVDDYVMTNDEITEEIAGMISDQIGSSIHHGSVTGIEAKNFWPEGPVTVIELTDGRVVRVKVEISERLGSSESDGGSLKYSGGH